MPERGHNSSYYFLVTLARNKEQRIMLTQYAKYKQQRAKAGEKTAPASVRRSPAEVLAAALEASGNRVAAMDFNSLNGDDRPLVIRAMTDLKNTLENALCPRRRSSVTNHRMAA